MSRKSYPKNRWFLMRKPGFILQLLIDRGLAVLRTGKP
jgi:hypothetical protein